MPRTATTRLRWMQYSISSPRPLPRKTRETSRESYLSGDPTDVEGRILATQQKISWGYRDKSHELGDFHRTAGSASGGIVLTTERQARSGVYTTTILEYDEGGRQSKNAETCSSTRSLVVCCPANRFEMHAEIWEKSFGAWRDKLQARTRHGPLHMDDDVLQRRPRQPPPPPPSPVEYGRTYWPTRIRLSPNLFLSRATVGTGPVARPEWLTAYWLS